MDASVSIDFPFTGNSRKDKRTKQIKNNSATQKSKGIAGHF
jgi:hypothetical protein